MGHPPPPPIRQRRRALGCASILAGNGSYAERKGKEGTRNAMARPRREGAMEVMSSHSAGTRSAPTFGCGRLSRTMESKSLRKCGNSCTWPTGRSRRRQKSRGRNGNDRVHQAEAGRVDPEKLIRMALDQAATNGREASGFGLAQQLRDNGYTEGEGAFGDAMLSLPHW